MNTAVNRRTFLETCSMAALGAGLASESRAASGEEHAEPKPEEENPMSALQCPLDWLNAAYKHAAEDNVLAALNPKVFFGYFSVCADGQGFGYANSYLSLDGHQLSHALLFLGKKEEVLANWEFVKRHQKPDGHLPIMIDAKGEGLYVHWCPGDPLRALGPVTYAHNAYAIFTHTLNEPWLRDNLPSINLAMEYLASLITAEGRVGGAGFYVEMPTRIEWDGVTQCYAVDALDRAAKLNRRAGDEKQGAHWAELAGRVRDNFNREFWRGDHCVEYIHPEHGPIDRHGLTDVDWAALAVARRDGGMLETHAADGLWQRLKDDPGFRYGGMPTGIATAPDTYEDWEFIPADKYPNQDRRHDLAAMGRAWYLESWARAQRRDIAGLLSGLEAVARVGARNGYKWQERYFPSKAEPRPGGPLTYCEYPANMIRIVNQFLLNVDPRVDGTIRIAPQLPANWWTQGWRTTTHIGDGVLSLQGQEGLLKVSWRDNVARRLLFIAPSARAWRAKTGEDRELTVNGNEAVRKVPGGVPWQCELPLG